MRSTTAAAPEGSGRGARVRTALAEREREADGEAGRALGLASALVVLVVVGFVVAGWVRPDRRWPRLTMSARMALFVLEGILKASSRFLKGDASRQAGGKCQDACWTGRRRGGNAAEDIRAKNGLDEVFLEHLVGRRDAGGLEGGGQKEAGGGQTADGMSVARTRSGGG